MFHSGSLATEIGALSCLEHISVQHNKLTGKLQMRFQMYLADMKTHEYSKAHFAMSHGVYNCARGTSV